MAAYEIQNSFKKQRFLLKAHEMSYASDAFIFCVLDFESHATQHFRRRRFVMFSSQTQCGHGDAWQVAVWGKPVSTNHVLKPTDRVEVLRGLRVDPKVARRERFQKQGARAAGLFAKRRAGAKPGY